MSATPKIALITGGSRGLGAAIARRLHTNGYTVIINYVNSKERAEALAHELDGLAVQADVGDPDQVRAMVATVLERFARLDALVCNAAVAWQGLTQDMSDTDYRKIMSTDLDGAFYCCRSALPTMIRQKAGRIVLLSSMWGEVGGACEGAYSAAKGGLLALGKSLAKEVGPSGITVNLVSPGVIDTDMNAHLTPEDLSALCEETPLGRIGKPEEVAAAVAFLCSEEAGFITGADLPVNGGLVI